MRMRVRRIAEEDLLTRRQLRIGGRLYAPCLPCHVRNTVFVEQRAPLVLGLPGCRPMCKGLSEQDGRTVQALQE